LSVSEEGREEEEDEGDGRRGGRGILDKELWRRKGRAREEEESQERANGRKQRELDGEKTYRSASNFSNTFLFV